MTRCISRTWKGIGMSFLPKRRHEKILRSVQRKSVLLKGKMTQKMSHKIKRRHLCFTKRSPMWDHQGRHSVSSIRRRSKSSRKGTRTWVWVSLMQHTFYRANGDLFLTLKSNHSCRWPRKTQKDSMFNQSLDKNPKKQKSWKQRSRHYNCHR